MDNKPILKELNDHFSKITPMLLKEDLEQNQMQLFLHEKESQKRKDHQVFGVPAELRRQPAAH